MAAFDHRAPGTAETAWGDAAPWRAGAPVQLTADRLVVLAAHPDDETLGAAGLLALAADRGIPVDVIVATSGADRMRRLESAAALAIVAPEASLRVLGLPDGGLHRDPALLEQRLRALLDDSADDILVVAPWWGDGHSDHETLGEVALRLRRPGRRVLGYPIWLWHWGDPSVVDTTGWLRLDLPPDAVRRKAQAILAHRSQLTGTPTDGPMLHPGMLAHFARDVEVFVEAPVPTAVPTTPPSRFDARFDAEPDPWGFETRWYERRKRDMLLASLPAERYRTGLELGCANGSLTARLVDRVDDLLAVDGSPAALRRARERVPGGARFEQHVLPGDWPAGDFDLIVFSEMGFYLSADDLERTIDRMQASLTGGGVLVACHWRPAVHDGPLRGDDVHAALRARRSLTTVVRHVEDEFLLDVFEKRVP